jgi:hypothetical protein
MDVPRLILLDAASLLGKRQLFNQVRTVKPFDAVTMGSDSSLLLNAQTACIDAQSALYDSSTH